MFIGLNKKNKIMKKTAYIAPAIKTRIIYIESALASASNGTTSDNGIGYGGVDEDGTRDPAAKDEDIYWDSPIDE
jgi:hypothetical protein